jgi:ABC-type lipoprotein export system ATPase subunit
VIGDSPGVNAIDILVISGSMGSGKTTVLNEASDLLTAAGVPHAAIDLDCLDLGHMPGPPSDELVLRNLAAVWNNYAALGITKLLLSEAVDTAAKLERLEAALPGARIQVCRLRATLGTMQERIRTREPGMLQNQFVARAAELEASLDAGGVEHFTVNNDRRPITEVACEVLTRAGWL